MFVLITGCRWIDLPARYDSKSSAHRRFQDLQQKGVWKNILKNAIKSAHKSGRLNLQKISVDSSSIAAKKGDKIGRDGFKTVAYGHDLILGTKIHVAAEQNGFPISIVVGPANEHDSMKFVDVTETTLDFTDDDIINEIVSAYADKGYDAKYIRNYLRNNGINCCIPYKSNSKYFTK